VKRVIFTSSFASVGHPAPEGYVFTERDWCDHNAHKDYWKTENISKIRDVAYAMAKAEGEKVAKKMAEEHGGFDTISICPLHVLGPLTCANHNQGWSWQNCVGQMMEGKNFVKVRNGRMLWNIVDVRDCGEVQRLAAESTTVRNGARYIMAAHDRTGELTTKELQGKLKELYPGVQVGGEVKEGRTYDSPRSYCLLAKQELGLEPYKAEDTIRATADSLIRLGLIQPARASAPLSKL